MLFCEEAIHQEVIGWEVDVDLETAHCHFKLLKSLIFILYFTVGQVPYHSRFIQVNSKRVESKY